MITGYTKLAAVVASPIKHSISPLIQNTAFNARGVDAVYLAFEVGPDKLADVFESIRHLEMLGVNLSMPNKQRGFELVDEASEVATLLGSINTVVNQEGRLIGHSTDGVGFVASLAEEGVTLRNKKITILGAGGAALAIVAQVAFDGVSEINVFARNLEAKEEVKSQLENISVKTNCPLHFLPLEEEELLKQEIYYSDILVNATNVGMTPQETGNLIPDKSWLRAELVVADIIYEPRQTALLKMAASQGCLCINGLGMLLHQGAAAFELWTGQTMPLKEVRQALIDNL